MCEHKKPRAMVSTLCQKCKAANNFDRKQIERLRKMVKK